MFAASERRHAASTSPSSFIRATKSSGHARVSRKPEKAMAPMMRATDAKRNAEMGTKPGSLRNLLSPALLAEDRQQRPWLVKTSPERSLATNQETLAAGGPKAALSSTPIYRRRGQNDERAVILKPGKSAAIGTPGIAEGLPAQSRFQFRLSRLERVCQSRREIGEHLRSNTSSSSIEASLFGVAFDARFEGYWVRHGIAAPGKFL